MKRPHLFGLLLSLSGLMTAAPAGAEDFTFQVRLEVTNLLFRTRPIVECSVYQGTVLIGSASSSPLSVSDGRRFGMVTLKFNAQPGKNPADADRYRCLLRIAKLDSNPFSDRIDWITEPAFSVGPEWARAKPGTQLVKVLEGPID